MKILIFYCMITLFVINTNARSPRRIPSYTFSLINLTSDTIFFINDDFQLFSDLKYKYYFKDTLGVGPFADGTTFSVLIGVKGKPKSRCLMVSLFSDPKTGRKYMIDSTTFNEATEEACGPVFGLEYL